MHVTPRSTRSSVLGKRTHTQSSSDSTAHSICDEGVVLPTPDPSPDPKRLRTTTSVLDGDGNKENIPPIVFTVLNRTPSRRVRRSSTETSVSPRRTPRRTASSTDLTASPRTPSTSFNSLSLSTPPPSPPSALLPLHVRVRALLRATSNGVTGMTGRAEERAFLEAFIASFLASEEQGHTSLYISGSPGTGKTALVNDVLRLSRGKFDAHNVRATVINCMAIKGVDAVWNSLAEVIDDERIQGRRTRKLKETPAQRVQRLLTAKDIKIVVVLDELDHAVADEQSLLALFTYAQTLGARLRVVGIANTHTLTTSTTTAALESVHSVKTVHFAPYSPEQLLQIILSRLAPLYDDADCVARVKQFLPTTALTLLSKKVASQSGDVRATFEALRGAIDLALAEVTSDDPLSAPSPIVTPANILAALKAPPSSAGTVLSGAGRSRPASEMVEKVRGLGLHQRLVLLALVLARQRADAGLTLSGSVAASSPPKAPRTPVKRTQSASAAASASHGNIDAARLHGFYSAILVRGDSAVFTPVSRSEFMDLLGLLETVGLVALSTGRSSMPGTPSKSARKGFARSSSFTTGSGKGNTQEVSFVADVRLEEVLRGLGLGVSGAEAEPPVDAREEEVRAIWERERARMAREVKASARAAVTTDVFEDAMEA